MLTNTVWKISATAELKLDEEVFESSQESTILAREQSRRSKMEGAYKKGLPIEQSNHTITFLPAGRSITIINHFREGYWQLGSAAMLLLMAHYLTIKGRTEPQKLPKLREMAEREEVETLEAVTTQQNALATMELISQQQAPKHQAASAFRRHRKPNECDTSRRKQKQKPKN